MSEVDAASAVAQRNRAATRMAVLTVISRGTGFIRVVVVAAVLGTSYLGNTYQSANTVPNILFELFAAGVLQSVLVPVMVEAVDRFDRDETEHTAGVVLGAMLTLLAGIVAAGMIAAPWIMRVLVSGVDSAAVRDAQVQLGTFLLWFFLPQILFYAVNMVATAVLNASGYFALPVFAPTVNNVVVIGAYLLFAVMRDGQEPTLDITTAEKLVLAVGTTAAVIAFCLVPMWGLRRIGFRLRPSFRLRHPMLRRLARQGLWAAGFLVTSNILLIVVLYLSNAVEGGVVVYQLAYVLFTLPHSLFAVPVFTTAFPALTRDANADNWTAFGFEVARATRSIMFFSLASTGALIALAEPLSHLMALGNAAGHTTEVAGAIAAFAIGLPGFSVILFLSRVTYANGDMRTPTLVNIGVVVVGVVAMSLLASVASASNRVTMIALGYSLSQTVGAIVLAVLVARLLHARGGRAPQVVVPSIRAAVAAAVPSIVLLVVVSRLDPTSRTAALMTVLVGSALLGAAILGLLWAIGGPAPVRALRSLGGDPGRHRVHA